MIAGQRRSWLRTILSFRGSALQKIWMRLILTTAVAGGVTALHEHYDSFRVDITVTPYSLIGLALSIFLGFRNNTGYDRFWEGRKLWGRLVNTSRSLARQVTTLVDADPEQHRELVHRVIAYVHAFRMHLRDEHDGEALRGLLPDDEVDALEAEHNRPIAILRTLGQRFRAQLDDGHVDRYHLPVLEQSLTDLTDIQGGCERIKATPIPYSYTMLIHRIVALYCFTLPFGIVSTVHHFTPVVVLIVSYAFYGLDAVGDEIEEPFGRDYNDLPLDTMSRMIEVNLRQHLGETDLPPLLEPRDDLLL